MDADIHAAIVGGLIGGATLGVGVVLGEWLQRARDRRGQFEESLARLALALPHVTTPASAKWAGPRPPKGEWVSGYMAVHDQMLRLLRLCRGFRHARAARAALETLLVRSNVLLEEYFRNDRILSVEEMLEVSAHDVMQAMKPPGQRYLDDDVKAYRRKLGLHEDPSSRT